MRWQKPAGWILVIWGIGTVVLGLAGALDNLVFAILVGPGLAVTGLRLILNDGSRAASDQGSRRAGRSGVV